MTPTPTITPTTRGPENVLAGWLGIRVPPPPRQRNKTRAAYRKTTQKRPRRPGQQTPVA